MSYHGWSLACCVLVVMAHTSAMQPSIDAADAIGELVARYETVRSVAVRTRSINTDLPLVYRQIVVASDGRLAEKTWLNRSGTADAIWNSQASHERYLDHHWLCATRSTETYMCLPLSDVGGEQRLESDPAQHLAPWSRVSHWAGMLKVSKDLRYVKEGNVHRASSVHLGLELGWDDKGRLLSLRSGDSTSGVLEEFFGHRDGSPVDLPSKARLVYLANGEPKKTLDGAAYPPLEIEITSLEINVSDLESHLSSKPMTSKLDRYEPSTGDVFRPSGEFRYNEPDLFRALELRESGGLWWRWLLRGAVAVVVLISSNIVIYRWRRA